MMTVTIAKSLFNVTTPVKTLHNPSMGWFCRKKLPLQFPVTSLHWMLLPSCLYFLGMWSQWLFWECSHSISCVILRHHLCGSSSVFLLRPLQLSAWGLGWLTEGYVAPVASSGASDVLLQLTWRQLSVSQSLCRAAFCSNPELGLKRQLFQLNDGDLIVTNRAKSACLFISLWEWKCSELELSVIFLC